MLISAELLRRLGVRVPGPWAGPLSAACAAQGITTPLRLACFLPNVLWETTMLSRLVESLDYTPARLLEQWPLHFPPAAAHALGRTADRPADQQGIAELAYGGRFGNQNPGSGDGWLFRGRGGLQTTFRANYVALACSIGWRDPVEALPAWLETPAGAATSAALYWSAHGCNAVADNGDLAECRRRIQGGTDGLGVVTVLHRSVLEALCMPGEVELPALPVVTHPPVLVQPGSIKVLPVPPPPFLSDAAERIVTEQLNERAFTAALNQRPK